MVRFSWEMRQVDVAKERWWGMADRRRSCALLHKVGRRQNLESFLPRQAQPSKPHGTTGGIVDDSLFLCDCYALYVDHFSLSLFLSVSLQLLMLGQSFACCDGFSLLSSFVFSNQPYTAWEAGTFWSRARSVVSERKGRVKTAGAGDSVSDVADVGELDGANRGESQHSCQGGVRDFLCAVVLAAEVDDVWEKVSKCRIGRAHV